MQIGKGPDYFSNVLDLGFSPGSVRNIETRHMFEHFSRPVAPALLCAWSTRMETGGELVIETPDFDKAIERYLATSDFGTKQVVLRHLFGSHEADWWAYHYDGWNRDKFFHILPLLGFARIESSRFSWQSTDNIVIRAEKTEERTSKQKKAACYEILRLSCVDDSRSETVLLGIWCERFDEAPEKMGGTR